MHAAASKPGPLDRDALAPTLRTMFERFAEAMEAHAAEVPAGAEREAFVVKAAEAREEAAFFAGVVAARRALVN